jgi:hypothetical protein
VSESADYVPGRFRPLTLRWYVVLDDLIGGYSISHVDKPLSQHDLLNGEGEIIDCLTREIADHVAALHNAHIDSSGVPG